MTRSFRITAAATMLLLVKLATGFAATAQTFEEGMRAYRSDEYETAYRAFRGLAEEGDRRAQGSLGHTLPFRSVAAGRGATAGDCGV